MKGILQNIQAVIFDLNGTILSDEDEYGLAFKKVLKKLGVNQNQEYPHQTGIGVVNNWFEFKSKYQLKTDKTADELAQETQNEYLNLLSQVTLKEGVIEFIESLKNRGIKVALATSNNFNLVERIFVKFDLGKYFDCVTTADEVTKNKPDPEIFKTTAKKMDVDPKDCLVFEDSPAGVKAAHLAGMQVIGVLTDGKGRSQLKGAERAIASYKDLSI